MAQKDDFERIDVTNKSEAADDGSSVLGCFILLLAFAAVSIGIYSLCNISSSTPKEDASTKIERLEANPPCDKNDSTYIEEKEKIDLLLASFRKNYQPEKIFISNGSLYVVMNIPTDYGYDQVAEGYALEIKEKNIKSIRGVVIINSKTAKPAGTAITMTSYE